MNVKESPQYVIVMLIALILMVAMSVHTEKDTMALEHSALVIFS